MTSIAADFGLVVNVEGTVVTEFACVAAIVVTGLAMVSKEGCVARRPAGLDNHAQRQATATKYDLLCYGMAIRVGETDGLLRDFMGGGPGKRCWWREKIWRAT